MGWSVSSISATGVQGLSGGAQFTGAIDAALKTLNPNLRDTTTQDLANPAYSVQSAVDARAQQTAAGERTTNTGISM